MKKYLIAAVSLPALSMATLASAADLPRRSAAPAYAPYNAEAYAPAPIWTGFYLGGLAGVGWGGFNGGGVTYFGKSTGVSLGGTAGYNYQSGNLLVGVEGDMSFTHIAGERSPFPGVGSSGQVQNITTIRARAGYAMDRSLFYVTGGYAGADVRGVMVNPSYRSVADEAHFQSGFAAGFGAEYAITPRISAKAEYIYSYVGGANYFGGTPSAMNSGTNLNLVRGGVNYHF